MSPFSLYNHHRFLSGAEGLPGPCFVFREEQVGAGACGQLLRLHPFETNEECQIDWVILPNLCDLRGHKRQYIPVENVCQPLTDTTQIQMIELGNK